MSYSAPSISYGQSGEPFSPSLGAPVYRDALGFFRLASAADPSKCPAVGIVAVSSNQNLTVGVINAGFLSQNNWAAITGTQLLVSGTAYYLSVSAGKLTTNAGEAGSVLVQMFGRATNSTTMQVLGNISLSPPGGLTLNFNVAEDTLGAYWSLSFQNGLLSGAVHHLAQTTTVVCADGSGGLWRLVAQPDGSLGTDTTTGPATPDVILADNIGGFWKIVVDNAGNRGAESNAGPATTAPILDDGVGGRWQIVVDAQGNLGLNPV